MILHTIGAGIKEAAYMKHENSPGDADTRLQPGTFLVGGGNSNLCTTTPPFTTTLSLKIRFPGSCPADRLWNYWSLKLQLCFFQELHLSPRICPPDSVFVHYCCWTCRGRCHRICPRVSPWRRLPCACDRF